MDFDLLWTSTYDSIWLWFPLHDPYISPVSSYKFIRCLHLIAVTNLTSEAVSSMLSEFRYLPSLIIKECHGLHSLRIDIGSFFSKLTILNCLQLKSLHIKSNIIKIDNSFVGSFRALLVNLLDIHIILVLQMPCLILGEGQGIIILRISIQTPLYQPLDVPEFLLYADGLLRYAFCIYFPIFQLLTVRIF